MSLSRDIELLFEVGTMRHIQRTWKQFMNPDFENLSEHTMRVTWIALMIAKHEGLEDTGKLVKMALVHDLSESRSVDVHYVSRQFAERFEEPAITETLKDTALSDEFLALWKENEERQSLESKIVKDADNLDVDFELREQAARGFQIATDLQPMRQQVADTKLYTKTAKKIWAALKTANPNSWHMNSSNRFNAGDWKK